MRDKVRGGGDCIDPVGGPIVGWLLTQSTANGATEGDRGHQEVEM